MKTISVLIGTYNGEKFLQQQLDSIARQEYQPCELVVSDDKSSDRTLNIVDSFARTAPFPVHVNRNDKNVGFRSNFMRGLSLCRSDLVAFCDQDDIWDPRKLAVARMAFEDPDVLLFFHNAWLIDDKNNRLAAADLHILPATNPPLTVHSQFSPYGFSMVFDSRLKAFSELWPRSIASGAPKEAMAHDTWIFFLASIFGTIICSQQKLADYRQHGSNVFGYPHASWRARIRRGFANNTADYADQARAMQRRALILAESAKWLTGEWRSRALAGERRCRQLSDRLDSRAKLYGEAGPLERARIVLRLYLSGAYALDSGFGLTGGVFKKDVTLGVLLRRFLT